MKVHSATTRRRVAVTLLLGMLVAATGVPSTPATPVAAASQSTSPDDDVRRSPRRIQAAEAAGAITFSEFSVGTSITDQYQDRGILFSGDAPYIATDGCNPTSPVLSGTPQFEGAIEGIFVVPGTKTPITVTGFSLDVGCIDDPGAVEITYYDADGSTIGSVPATEYGINTISVSEPGIQGFVVHAVADETAGFAIDNVLFEPPVAPPPEPPVVPPPDPPVAPPPDPPVAPPPDAPVAPPPDAPGNPAKTKTVVPTTGVVPGSGAQKAVFAWGAGCTQDTGGGSDCHTGLDIAARRSDGEKGTVAVYPMRDGVVAERGCVNYLGWRVVIDHGPVGNGKRLFGVYAHMGDGDGRLTANDCDRPGYLQVRKGATVTTNKPIGYQGNSGMAYGENNQGIHLHFALTVAPDKAHLKGGYFNPKDCIGDGPYTGGKTISRAACPKVRP